jgi:hypothetical protein
MFAKKSLSKALFAFAMVLCTSGEIYAQNDDSTKQPATQKVGQVLAESLLLAKTIGRDCYRHGQARTNLQTRLDSLRKIRNLRRAQALEAYEIEQQIAHFDLVCDTNLR